MTTPDNITLARFMQSYKSKENHIMEMIDKSLEPPPNEDRLRAIAVVQGAIVKDTLKLMSVSQALALELTNILRCLKS